MSVAKRVADEMDGSFLHSVLYELVFLINLAQFNWARRSDTQYALKI